MTCWRAPGSEERPLASLVLRGIMRRPPPQMALARAGAPSIRDLVPGGRVAGRDCCNEQLDRHHITGPVAQWIRHRPTEPGIAGSSPAGVIILQCGAPPHAASHTTGTDSLAIGQRTSRRRSNTLFDWGLALAMALLQELSHLNRLPRGGMAQRQRV